MKKFRYLIIIIILNLSFINLSYSETLNLPAGIWEGDVKKGKAHGKGVITFKNGAVYEGKISKNRIHGVGKLINKDGEVYEGKWRYGKFYQKIDKKTRKVIILQTKGRFYWERHEIRGTDNASRKWFAAEKKSGEFVLTAAGKRKMELALKSENDSSSDSSSSGC